MIEIGKLLNLQCNMLWSHLHLIHPFFQKTSAPGLNLYFYCIFIPFIACIVTGISLAVGSFLNVVIVRLPELLFITVTAPKTRNTSPIKITPYFTSSMQVLKTLSYPRSRCIQCKHPLAIADLIPIFSYYRLKAQCRYCKTVISFRYPFVEIITLLVSLLITLHFGLQLQTFAALLFAWSLIAIAFIDIENFIIPNCITFPFIVLGLSCNAFGLFQSFENAILGTIFGYASLWSILYIYKFLTNKEGLGFGDLKLLAMLGAWLGWQILPFIILFSSVLGATWGIILMLLGRANRNTPLPFGAFLALAGVIALFFMPQR